MEGTEMQKFQKYLINYKFLQCFLLLLYILAPVLRVYSSKAIIIITWKLPVILCPFVQALKHRKLELVLNIETQSHVFVGLGHFPRTFPPEKNVNNFS